MSKRTPPPVPDMYKQDLHAPTPPKSPKSPKVQKEKRGPRPPSTNYDPKSGPPPKPDQYRKGPRPPSTAFEQKVKNGSHYSDEAVESTSTSCCFFTSTNQSNSDSLRSENRKMYKGGYDEDDFEDPDLDRRTGKLRVFEDKKVWQRAVVAALAVSLLWSTSLGVTRAIVNEFIPVPSMDDVGNEMNVFSSILEDQRDAYRECTLPEITTCDETFETDHKNQVDSVAANLSINEGLLVANGEKRLDAKVKFNDTLNHLIALNKDGTIPTADLNGKYRTVQDEGSAGNCPRIIAFIEGRIQAASAIALLEEFDRNSEAHLLSLEEQLQARIDYDNDYVANKTREIREFAAKMAEQARNRTKAIYDQMALDFANYQNCMGAGDGACNLPGILIKQGVNVPEGGILGKMETDFNLTIGNKIAGLEVVKADLDGQLADFTNNFDGIITTIDVANDNLGTVNIDLIDVPVNPPQPPDISLGDLQDPALFDIGEIEGDLGTLLGGLDDVLGNLSLDADLGVLNFNQSLIDGYNIGLENYRPPNITQNPLDDYRIQQNQTQEEFKETLGDYQTGEESSDDSFFPPSQTQINFPENEEEVLALLPNRTFDFYAYDSSVFNQLQTNLEFAGELLIWADVAFRILHTLYLINKYWNLSSLGKPPGDARLNFMSGRNWGMKATPDQKIARILTHPFTIALVSIGFLSLMSYTAWKMYEPFFDAYVDGCITHNAREIVIEQKSDGTMFFRNAFAVGFAYAAQEGDALQTTRINEVNVRAETECEVNFANSSRLFGDQEELFAAIQKDYLETVAFNEEFKTCLDVTTMTADTIGVTGINFVDLTADPLFDGLDPLLDAIYQCDQVLKEGCGFICGDPSTGVIRDSAHVASCTSEWYIHSNITSAGLILFTFILLNMFRIEVVKAIVRIWWRHISPGDFSFLASCTRQGEHLDPEQVTEEGMGMRQTIREAVRDSIRKWERWGYVHVVYACCLNIPWIMALNFLSQNITYEK